MEYKLVTYKHLVVGQEIKGTKIGECSRYFSAFVTSINPAYITVEMWRKNGKEAKIYAVAQKDGTLGLSYNIGDLFDVHLENALELPTSIHWHGLILPCAQDGAAFVTQFPIYPKVSYNYQFPIVQSGTFWMHSHFGLEIQNLLEAPLILHDPAEDLLSDQEAVILLSDFSFKSPEAIFEKLKSAKHNTSMKMEDIVEVDYDAFLANLRTLEDPETTKTAPGKIVRLRFINGASSTNFFLDLTPLEGTAIAVDGNRIEPVIGSQFELAVAQRIDVLVTIPMEEELFPFWLKAKAQISKQESFSRQKEPSRQSSLRKPQKKPADLRMSKKPNFELFLHYPKNRSLEKSGSN